MMYEVGADCARFYLEKYWSVCESRILCCVVKIVDKIRALKMGVMMGVVKSCMQIVPKKLTTQKLLVKIQKLNIQKPKAWRNVIQRSEWPASMFKCSKRNDSCGGNNRYERNNEGLMLSCCMLVACY